MPCPRDASYSKAEYCASTQFKTCASARSSLIWREDSPPMCMTTMSGQYRISYRLFNSTAKVDFFSIYKKAGLKESILLRTSARMIEKALGTQFA
jgi:hypothetical protein